MARIIVVSASEESRTRISRLLASSGFTVFRACGNESELRRTVNTCEDGIVILFGTVPGLRVDDLLWDWGGRLQFLLVAKPEVLEGCESREVFKLALPASSQTLVGAVGMLDQLHRMRLPRRSGTDRETVEKAKGILMRQKGLTESEAHREMQQYAMRHGIRMADHAARIINESADTEE